jgi:sugar-specific transcriptional regulator TrmB
MKKIAIIILMFLLFIWYAEKRSIYKVAEDKYITIWKTLNNVCYITPYKYYGIFWPSDNYIKTTNDNYLVLFLSNNMPKTVIVWENKQDEPIEYINGNKTEVLIVDYSINQDSLHQILYKPNAKNVSDVKEGTVMININTKENYVTDKIGQKF